MGEGSPDKTVENFVLLNLFLMTLKVSEIIEEFLVRLGGICRESN